MIKTHVFHTGKVKVDIAIPLGERNPLAFTGLFRGKEKKCLLPVSCYLLEHPKGRILIDTGWDSKYATEELTTFGGLLDKISGPVIHADEGVDSKLKAMGLTVQDLDAVYLTHLDFDHTSGLRLVQDARSFYASQEEIADAKKYVFRYIKDTYDFVNIEPFDFQNTGIGPVGRSYDVFGDGTVLLVNTPGHTHGLFSAVVKGSDGRYLVLASDTVYLRESWEQRHYPGFHVDVDMALKSVDWIRECVADPNCIGVFANHDPEVVECVIEL